MQSCCFRRWITLSYYSHLWRGGRLIISVKSAIVRCFLAQYYFGKPDTLAPNYIISDYIINSSFRLHQPNFGLPCDTHNTAWSSCGINSQSKTLDVVLLYEARRFRAAIHQSWLTSSKSSLLSDPVNHISLPQVTRRVDSGTAALKAPASFPAPPKLSFGKLLLSDASMTESNHAGTLFSRKARKSLSSYWAASQLGPSRPQSTFRMTWRKVGFRDPSLFPGRSSIITRTAPCCWFTRRRGGFERPRVFRCMLWCCIFRLQIPRAFQRINSESNEAWTEYVFVYCVFTACLGLIASKRSTATQRKFVYSFVRILKYGCL